MRNKYSLDQEIRVIENLIIKLRSSISDDVPAGQKATPHHYIINHYLKDKLNKKDYQLLAVCSELDYLSGKLEALKFTLELGAWGITENKPTFKEDKDSLLPSDIQQIFYYYSGLHRHEITNLHAQLLTAYKDKDMHEQAKILNLLKVYIGL